MGDIEKSSPGLNTAVSGAPGAPPAAGLFGTLRHYGWKLWGSMWMEQKGTCWALSLHRVLGTLLFAVCLWLWLAEYAVPDAMVYTLWGLLGINGAKSLSTQAIKALKVPESGKEKGKK